MAFAAPDTDIESGFKAPDEDLPKFKAPDDEILPSFLTAPTSPLPLPSTAPSRQSLGIPNYTPYEAAQEKDRIANFGSADVIQGAGEGFVEGSGETSRKIDELSKQIPSGKEIADAAQKHGVPAWMAKLYTPTLTAASSVDKVALGLASFITSPSGAAQTGALAVPVVGEAQALKFAYDMIKGGVVNVQNAYKAIQDGDWQAFSDNAVGAVANLGLGGKLAHSKYKDFTTPSEPSKVATNAEKPTTNAPEPPAPSGAGFSLSNDLKDQLTILGSQLKMPEGAQPTPESIGPGYAEHIVPPDIEASASKPIAPSLPMPPKMEEQLKAAEISVSPGMEQAILDKKIKSPVALQRVFPNLKISIEEGQEILNQVWKTSDNVPEKYQGQQKVESTVNEGDFSNIQRPSKVGVDEGAPLTGLDVPRLESQLKTAKQEAMDAVRSKDQNAYKAAMGKMVYLSGAIEGAKKSGPNFEVVKNEPVVPKTETTPENPPAISESAPEVKQETASPEQATGGGTNLPSEATSTKSAEPVNENTTGIAHRVSESEGMAAERGQGIGAEESVKKGRELLAKGADPQKVIDDFNNDPDKAVSANGMAIVRAHNETLAKAKNEAADKFGVDSPEYKATWDAHKAWKDKVKPMQTEWHKQGMAQQGETEIDTGTFQGLQEAYYNAAKKDFTPKQAKEAKATAAKVQKARGEEDVAKKAVFDALAKLPAEAPKVRLSDKIVSELDKRATEALKRIKSRSGRLSTGLDPTDLADHAIYGAAKIAKGVVKFADWSSEMVKDLGEYVKPHLKQIWQAANKEVGQHDQVKAVWNAAKGYLEKGETDFDDLVHKLSADFGLTPKEIRELLAQPKSIRKMTDDMYRKMDAQRKVTNQAKDWLVNAKYPKWMQYLRNIPKVFFTAKVFGHGTVGMITHAGNQMFNPLAAKNYWTNFFRQFKLMGVHDQGAYHEQMMQDLVRDPNFIMAKRAGLANDPFKYTDDYQNSFMVKFFHKIGLMGNRGFDALKLYRQDRFNARWQSLPDSLKTKEMAQLLADIGNHETGVVKARLGGEYSNWLLFAPKLEGSRWSFLIGDPAKAGKIIANWKNETPEARQYAMREVTSKAIIAGTYFSALMVNQGFLSAAGSDQKINWTNPRKGDWLSFKVAGHNLGIISPMIGSVRFLANIIHDSAAKRSKFEQLQSTRADEMSKDTGKYFRMKLSPFAGDVWDNASQSDFQGRTMPWSNDKIPAYKVRQGITQYGYGEYAAYQIAPIPIEDALKEVWKSQGMDESKIKVALNALAVAAVVGGTGARLSDDNSVK